MHCMSQVHGEHFLGLRSEPLQHIDAHVLLVLTCVQVMHHNAMQLCTVHIVTMTHSSTILPMITCTHA